jgi:16S rRNA G966 N2-methylase RsmD
VLYCLRFSVLMNVPEKKVNLTTGLVFQFLGGIVVVKNPYAIHRGTVDNLSFDPTLKERNLSVWFAQLEELPPESKNVFTDPPLQTRAMQTDYLMVFELSWVATTPNGLLIIHTSNKDESLILKDPLT